MDAEIAVQSRCGELLAEMSLRDKPVGEMLKVAVKHGRLGPVRLNWVDRGVIVVGWKNVCPRCRALCGEPWLLEAAAVSRATGHGNPVQIDAARWLIPTTAQVGERGHVCEADPPCDPTSSRWRDAGKPPPLETDLR